MLEREKVCAVVVTYNRKELLSESLEAIKKQTNLPEGIYIIDNASSDGTADTLLANGYIITLPPTNLDSPWETTSSIPYKDSQINIHYIRMHKNTGGSGGFYEGIKQAFNKQYDWLWLMDDDAIASENALERLIYARKVLNDHPEFLFFCSHVVWTDGNQHMMNLPAVSMSTSDRLYTYLYPKWPYILIEWCSFVSVLVSKKYIELYGFPREDFFIWYDDVDFFTRSLKKHFGIYVFDSVCTHKSRKNINIDIRNPDIEPKKIFYNARNSVLIARRYGRRRLLDVVASNLFNLFYFLVRLNLVKAYFVLKGLIYGIIFK